MGTMLGIKPSTVSKHLTAIANKAGCGAEELDAIFLDRPDWDPDSGGKKGTQEGS